LNSFSYEVEEEEKERSSLGIAKKRNQLLEWPELLT
jgi:hypothetical protein